MINIQPQLDKLDLLREWIDLIVDVRLKEYKNIQDTFYLFDECGILYYKVAEDNYCTISFDVWASSKLLSYSKEQNDKMINFLFPKSHF